MRIVLKQCFYKNNTIGVKIGLFSYFMTNKDSLYQWSAVASVLFISSVLSAQKHTRAQPGDSEGSWEPHLSWTTLLIVALLLLQLSPNSAQFQLNFICVIMFLHLTFLMLLKRQWSVKEPRYAKGRVWRGFTGSHCLRDSAVTVFVCVCGYTLQPQSPGPSSCVPLHSAVFWASDKDKRQCFRNEQQPGAQTGWKRRRERWRGRGREKASQSRLVPLFSVWLCPLPWRFEIDLETHQTWIHG